MYRKRTKTDTSVDIEKMKERYGEPERGGRE
jgi:hypothetical protein